MTETKGKKALSLCILRVLEQHAGKAQPLSTRHIIEYLKDDFGMIAERKAVGRNLLLLQEMGFPLSTYQENGRAIISSRANRPRRRNSRCRSIRRRSTRICARRVPRRRSERSRGCRTTSRSMSRTPSASSRTRACLRRSPF